MAGAACWRPVSLRRALAAYRLSFGAALTAAAINGVFGLLTAWALVRYRFPGKALVNALVDLPFALPTAVAGIALAALYAPARLDRQRSWRQLGIKVAYTPLGVVIALTFIGLPFVVRTLEPVMRDLADDVEEAAASLGASRSPTLAKVVLPSLAPAWLTGFALAFARAVGEYGSVIFIAGNMPYQLRDRAPADRHRAGAVQLPGGRRHRPGHAGRRLRHAVRDQRRPGLGEAVHA